MKRTIVSTLLAIATLGGGALGSAAPTEAAATYNPVPPTSLTLTSTSAACAATVKDPSRGVFMVGDSITAAGLPWLTNAFSAASRPGCINARSGRKTLEAISVLQATAKAGRLPRTVVVATGTNDTHLSGPDIAAQIRAVRAAIGPTRRLVWVNIYNHRVTDLAATTAGTLRWNAALVQARDHHLINTVVYWEVRARASRPVLIEPDGLHLTPLGEDLRSSLIAVRL